MADKKNMFDGEIIVLTGTFATMKRSDAKKLLSDIGAKVSGSVSGKTKFLIHGKNAGSKLTKAQSLGVTIMTELEMVAALADDDRVGDRLGDADELISDQNAAANEKMAAVLEKTKPVQDASIKKYGLTIAQLLKCYFKVLAERTDIVVSKNEWARPTPDATLLKLVDQLPADVLSLFSEIGAFEFIWVLQADALAAGESSDGYNGGRINLVGLEKFRWWGRPDWGGHGEYEQDATFDDLQAEGYTVLSYDIGEKPTDAKLVFDDANQCERYFLGDIEWYMTGGAKSLFAWYWPGTYSSSNEFKDALLKTSIPAKTSVKKAVELLVEKGLTELEAKAVRKWLGTDVRVLLQK